MDFSGYFDGLQAPALPCEGPPCRAVRRRPESAAIQRVQALQCAGTPGSWRCPTDQFSNYEGVMSKGMDQKKNQKKEPTKTLKEKRAAKQEKKGK
ncbi:hypothetical protein [Xanthomonas axonopodis]